jgi:hypothetical protein
LIADAVVLDERQRGALADLGSDLGDVK